MRNLILSYEELVDAQKNLNGRIELGLDCTIAKKLYRISCCMFLAYVREYFGIYDIDLKTAKRLYESDEHIGKFSQEYKSFLEESETVKSITLSI